jgi:hypothetical protein
VYLSGIVEWTSGCLFDNYGSAPAWMIFSVAMTMIAVIASLALIFTDKKVNGIDPDGKISAFISG